MIARSAMCALALIILAPAATPAQTGSERHVASARAVFTEVESAISRRRLARRDTTITCADTGFDVEVRRYVDGSGRVRSLTLHGGTGDQVETARYFYDSAGRLRFAFATRGAVNGTRQEERVWFSPAGAVARRRTRLTSGPGYPFERIQPVPDARRWRRAACGA